MPDYRGYIARRLLSLVNLIDPDCKIVCDANEKWHFQRQWIQPSYSNAQENLVREAD